MILWRLPAGPGDSGGHPLILLQAGICDWRMWDPQMPALAEHFRVIRYDLRGFGQTPVPPGPYSHLADLGGLMPALGIERVRLIGCPKGGSYALDFALARPERVGAWCWPPARPAAIVRRNRCPTRRSGRP